MELSGDTSNIHPTESTQLYELVEQYIICRDKHQQQQLKLKDLYKLRPYVNAQPEKQHQTELLVALQYYKDQLFHCLQEISVIEEEIEKIKEALSEFAPPPGKSCYVSYKGEEFLFGFVGLPPVPQKFVFVKKSKNITNSYLPTYLPTYQKKNKLIANYKTMVTYV